MTQERQEIGTEFIDTHYRRFIDPKEFKRRLSKFFKITYFKESKNFKNLKENPVF